MEALTRRELAVPLVIAAIAAAEAVSFGPPRLALVLVVETAACLLLVLRRRWTWAVCTAAPSLVLSMTAFGPAVDELAAPILVVALAAYSLGRYLPDLRGAASVVLFAVAVLAASETPDITDVVFVCALLAPPYVFGRVLRALDVRNAQLAEQAELLLRLQAKVRADAVHAERTRIARELHDVIAHSVSAMVLQASAGEDLVRTDPSRAAVTMREVAATGRRALAETGRLLHLIRDTDDELGLEPDLGLDRLDELVEQFRRSGLDVQLQVDGSLVALPAGVDLSGYRIVQEALTNALKYAADRCARVRVRRSATELHIDAENLGRPGPAAGSGLGLVGMAERVQVFGGELTHGFTGDGRFVLSARLPLSEPA